MTPAMVAAIGFAAFGVAAGIATILLAVSYAIRVAWHIGAIEAAARKIAPHLFEELEQAPDGTMKPESEARREWDNDFAAPRATLREARTV